MAYVAPGESSLVPPAEVAEVDLYHAKSWITKYVFSQDAKVIAIQYSLTAIAIGLVALVLSWLIDSFYGVIRITRRISRRPASICRGGAPLAACIHRRRRPRCSRPTARLPGSVLGHRGPRPAP